MPIDKIGLIRQGEVLACSTQHLQVINGARNVEGEGFFRHFWPCDPADAAPIIDPPFQPGPFPMWENLHYLTLTSTRLNPGDISWLLMAAGSAARQMPALRRMELWNYDPATTCLFRYQSNQTPRDSQRPEMEILISWWLDGMTTEVAIPPLELLSEEICACWKEVASRHCGDWFDLRADIEYWRDYEWDGPVI